MPTAVLAPRPDRVEPGSQEKVAPLAPADLYSWLVDPRKFVAIYFFIGIALAFAACSIAGYQISKKNIYSDFKRFHRYISPEGLYYPTVSEMVAIAESQSKPDQTIVVVGGNSIFYGVGQNASELWSERLKTLLGSNYVVCNFAMPAGDPFDGAYWAAEALFKKHRKVLFVTIGLPGKTGTPGGSDVYGYTYWDACEKHLLFNYKPRKLAVTARLAALPEKERIKLDELQLRMKLDSLLYFEDLWTAVAYSKLFTVWTNVTAAAPWKPRQQFESETYVAPLVSTRFGNDVDLRLLRHYDKSYFELNTDTPKQAFWSKCSDEMKTFVPESFRKNCLVVVSTHAPASLAQLNSLEKSRELQSSILSQQYWQKAGYHSITMRDKLASEDFLDSRHLLASGGRKVADAVFEQIKTTGEAGFR